MSFLAQLEEDYRKQGYQVYSKHLKGLGPRPPDWQGVLPDLIAVQPERRIAVFIETSRTLADPLTSGRWRNAEQPNQAELHVFVHQASDRLILEKTLQREGIQAKVGLVQKRALRRRITAVSSAHWVRLVVGLLVIAILCYLLVWLASEFYQYEIDFYEPRDMERENSFSPVVPNQESFSNSFR